MIAPLRLHTPPLALSQLPDFPSRRPPCQSVAPPIWVASLAPPLWNLLESSSPHVQGINLLFVIGGDGTQFAGHLLFEEVQRAPATHSAPSAPAPYHSGPLGTSSSPLAPFAPLVRPPQAKKQQLNVSVVGGASLPPKPIYGLPRGPPMHIARHGQRSVRGEELQGRRPIAGQRPSFGRLLAQCPSRSTTTSSSSTVLSASTPPSRPPTQTRTTFLATCRTHVSTHPSLARPLRAFHPGRCGHRRQRLRGGDELCQGARDLIGHPSSASRASPPRPSPHRCTVLPGVHFAPRISLPRRAWGSSS